MTIAALFFIALNRRMGLRQRETMVESINLSRVDGIMKISRKILLGTLLFEGSGALLLSIRFIPLFGVGKGSEGTVLKVSGADLVNGTPIYDIKPYLPYADCKTDATGGFTDRTEKRRVEVEIPEDPAGKMDEERLQALKAVLREDPRPAYQEDPERVYAFEFGGKHVEFRVENGVLTVLRIE